MRYSIDKQRAKNSASENRLRGLARRLVVKLAAASGLWQLLGYEGIDDEPETFDNVELFPGIGFMARPAAAGKPEAVVIHIGGESNHPVIVATRDKSIQLELEADETAIFNSSGARVVIKANGQVHVTDSSGVALPLATKADLDELLSAITGAAVLAGDGGATFKANLLTALSAWPTGTTVLRGK